MARFSFFSRYSNSDPILEIARGNIPGVTHINKYGRNPSTGTEAADIWDGTNVWRAPSAPRVHRISSSSPLDDSRSRDGAARIIRIEGLKDWHSGPIREDIELQGETVLRTVNPYVIINRMYVLTNGAAGINDGEILAVADVDSTTTAKIRSGEGQTHMAIFGIAGTLTAYMTSYYASVNKVIGTGQGNMDMRLLFNSTPDTELLHFISKHTQGLNMTGSSAYSHEFKPYAVFPGPGIIKLESKNSSDNFDVSAGFDLILAGK